MTLTVQLVGTSAHKEGAPDFANDAVECERRSGCGVWAPIHASCFALEVGTSFASRRVTQVPDATIADLGQPLAIVAMGRN